eukprot:6024808-Prymnesium_polylepis.1
MLAGTTASTKGGGAGPGSTMRLGGVEISAGVGGASDGDGGAGDSGTGAGTGEASGSAGAAHGSGGAPSAG